MPGEWKPAPLEVSEAEEESGKIEALGEEETF